jgi:hypothetical protein
MNEQFNVPNNMDEWMVWHNSGDNVVVGNSKFEL